MKLGFSTAGCPAWDLDQIIEQASKLGDRLVVLCGLGETLHLPDADPLVRDPAAVRQRFRQADVELVALATCNAVRHQDEARTRQQIEQIRETLRLAEDLGGTSVRVFPDAERRGGADKQARSLQIINTLRDLAPVAAKCNSRIVLENYGDFATSRDLWFILDAVDHPAVRCCWNPCHAWLAGESASLSVPRLGSRIAMTSVVDARRDEDGQFESYALPGDGQVGIAHYLRLLQGVGFDGPVILDWPLRWDDTLAAPHAALPDGLGRLRAMLEALSAEPVLTAYKGDKTAPKFASRPSRTATGN